MMYVSCARGGIYRNGSWFDDVFLLNEFVDGGAADLSPEIVCELFPPYNYVRGLLTLFSDRPERVNRVRKVGQDVEADYTCGSGSVLARAETACVSRTVVYLLDRNKPRAVYETHRPNDRKNVAPLHADNDFLMVEQYFKADPKKVYLWIGSVGSVNYGHWLVDDLPRLKALSELRQRRPDAALIVVTIRTSPVHDQVHLDTCKLISYADQLGPVEVIAVEHEAKVFFEELFFVTPVSYHPFSKSPEALAYVARSALSIPLTEVDAQGLPKRIFVKRAVSGLRDLLNQSEVEQFLGDNGFVSVDTATMPFMQQVELFRNAELVIGCMGASMTNTMFSKAGTGVGYLAPSGWIEPFYWDLAAVRGHRYAACYGEAAAGADMPWRANYHISLGSLGRMLDSFDAAGLGLDMSRGSLVLFDGVRP